MGFLLQVRLTKKEECVETRVLAAETLAYMIEVSEELQRIAAISNHLVPTMASFLRWEPELSCMTGFVFPLVGFEPVEGIWGANSWCTGDPQLLLIFCYITMPSA